MIVAYNKNTTSYIEPNTPCDHWWRLYIRYLVLKREGRFDDKEIFFNYAREFIKRCMIKRSRHVMTPTKKTYTKQQILLSESIRKSLTFDEDKGSNLWALVNQDEQYISQEEKYETHTLGGRNNQSGDINNHDDINNKRNYNAVQNRQYHSQRQTVHSYSAYNTLKMQNKKEYKRRLYLKMKERDEYLLSGLERYRGPYEIGNVGSAVFITINQQIQSKQIQDECYGFIYYMRYQKKNDGSNEEEVVFSINYLDPNNQEIWRRTVRRESEVRLMGDGRWDYFWRQPYFQHLQNRLSAKTHHTYQGPKALDYQVEEHAEKWHKNHPQQDLKQPRRSAIGLADIEEKLNTERIARNNMELAQNTLNANSPLRPTSNNNNDNINDDNNMSVPTSADVTDVERVPVLKVRRRKRQLEPSQPPESEPELETDSEDIIDPVIQTVMGDDRPYKKRCMDQKEKETEENKGNQNEDEIDNILKEQSIWLKPSDMEIGEKVIYQLKQYEIKSIQKGYNMEKAALQWRGSIMAVDGTKELITVWLSDCTKLDPNMVNKDEENVNVRNRKTNEQLPIEKEINVDNEQKDIEVSMEDEIGNKAKQTQSEDV